MPATATVTETRGDAIEERAEWTSEERADHLAVLWFVAEAEGVPARLMRAYLSEERLMESELYQSIFSKGEARGEIKGQARGKAESILAVLSARGVPVSDTLRERILSCTDLATLDAWIQRAAVASTAAGVVRAKAPLRSRPRRASPHRR